MIVRCVSYASFIDTIALLLSHERFFLLLLEFFTLMKLAPLEVDRYLYIEKYLNEGIDVELFSAPFEVNRFLYSKHPSYDFAGYVFPAPLEVDRYLY